MNNLTSFKHDNFGEVRSEIKNNEPWFVAKDVAKALGYVNTSKAVNTHCKRVETCPTEMGGQVYHIQIIPEPDVYRLIIKSTLPAAEQFEAWIFEEVLPSIRKTGSYQYKNVKEPSRVKILNEFRAEVKTAKALGMDHKAAVWKANQITSNQYSNFDVNILRDFNVESDFKPTAERVFDLTGEHNNENIICDFINTCLIVDKEIKKNCNRIKPKELYQAYKSWCEISKHNPLNQKRFHAVFSKKIRRTARVLNGYRYYYGIKIKYDKVFSV